MAKIHSVSFSTVYQNGEWLFNKPGTDQLIPISELSPSEVSVVAFVLCNNNCPDELREYISRHLHTLSLNANMASPVKTQEISRFTSMFDMVWKSTKFDHVQYMLSHCKSVVIVRTSDFNVSTYYLTAFRHIEGLPLERAILGSAKNDRRFRDNGNGLQDLLIYVLNDLNLW